MTDKTLQGLMRERLEDYEKKIWEGVKQKKLCDEFSNSIGRKIDYSHFRSLLSIARKQALKTNDKFKQNTSNNDAVNFESAEKRSTENELNNINTDYVSLSEVNPTSHIDLSQYSRKRRKK